MYRNTLQNDTDLIEQSRKFFIINRCSFSGSHQVDFLKMHQQIDLIIHQ